MSWELISAQTHFANGHLAVVTECVRTPTRRREWTTVHRKQAVVIAPISVAGKVVLIQQERIPIRALIWEMPAGQIDEKETAEEVALRELREETGYELAPGGELIALGHVFASPGFTDEQQFLFAAKPVRRCTTGHAHEESEAIADCREFSTAEINRLVADGTISDSNTLAAWARLLASEIITVAES